MKSTKTIAILVLLAAFSATACRNTYNGAKADTKRAVQKTGHAVERTGDKIENAGR